MSTQRLYLIWHEDGRRARKPGLELLDPLPDAGGFYKIGISSDPEQRYSILKGGTPYRTRLVTTVALEGDSEAIEQAVHHALRRSRLRREWFFLGHDLVAAFKSADVLAEGDVVREGTPTITREELTEVLLGNAEQKIDGEQI